MTARERLEDVVRGQLDQAYLYGVILARRDEFVPLTYPESARAVATVLAAANGSGS